MSGIGPDPGVGTTIDYRNQYWYQYSIGYVADTGIGADIKINSRVDYLYGYYNSETSCVCMYVEYLYLSLFITATFSATEKKRFRWNEWKMNYGVKKQKEKWTIDIYLDNMIILLNVFCSETCNSQPGSRKTCQGMLFK